MSTHKRPTTTTQAKMLTCHALAREEHSSRGGLLLKPTGNFCILLGSSAAASYVPIKPAPTMDDNYATLSNRGQTSVRPLARQSAPPLVLGPISATPPVFCLEVVTHAVYKSPETNLRYISSSREIFPLERLDVISVFETVFSPLGISCVLPCKCW